MRCKGSGMEWSRCYPWESWKEACRSRTPGWSWSSPDCRWWRPENQPSVWELEYYLLLWRPVWPDWVICFTLGNFPSLLHHFLPKLPTVLGNFCKVSKIFHFSSGIILGNFYRHLATFYCSHWWQLTLQLNNSSTSKCLLRCSRLRR